MNGLTTIFPLDAALTVALFGFGALCCAALVLEDHEAYGFGWGWLAAFALGRLAGGLLVMIGLAMEIGPWARPLRELLLIASLLCLVEFARTGEEATRGRAPGPWIHLILLSGVMALGGAWGWTALDLIARTVLGVAGGLWTCRVFWRRGEASVWLRAAGAGVVLMVGALLASGLSAVVLPEDSLSAVGGGAWMSPPFKAAHAGSVLLFAGMIWGALIARQKADENDARERRAMIRPFWTFLSAALVLAGGCLLARVAGIRAEASFRKALLERTRSLAAAIETDQIGRLRGEPHDEGQPEYQRLVRRLTAMAEAQPDIQGVYLLGKRASGVVCLASARARRFIQRNAPFPEVCRIRAWIRTPLGQRAFEGEERIEGPIFDAHGRWFSSRVPLRENEKGPVVAVLGQDYEALRWERDLARTRIPFLMAALSVALGLAGGQAYGLHRARSARRLAALERRFSQLFERMLNGVAFHELVRNARGEPWDFRYREVNPAFERLTGLSRDEVLGRTFRDVLPDLESAWIEAFLRVASTGETERFEHFARPFKRWYRVSAYRPAPEQLVTVFSDVTERKQLEADLRANIERLNAAVDQAHAFVYVRRFEPDRYEFVGKGVETLLGFPSNTWTPELFHRSIEQCVPVGETRPADRRELMQRLREGRLDQWSVELVMRTPRGARRFLDTAAPLRDDEGRVTGALGLFQDITPLHEAREALLRTQRLLRGIAEASRALLTETEFLRAIQLAIECLGRAADAHRVSWFERHPHPATGEPCVSRRAEWRAEGIASGGDEALSQNVPVNHPAFQRWEALLLRRQGLHGPSREAPPEEGDMLRAQNVVAFAVVPFLCGNGKCAGFLRFDECRREREWSDAEMDLLAAAASACAAALERHRAQEVTRDALHRFEAIFQSNPMVAIQGVAWDGTILHWNHASETLYGYSAAEAIGRKRQDLILTAEAAAAFETDLQAMREKPLPVVGVERKMRSRDGRERFVFSAKFPLMHQGKTEEIFCLDVDITERRQLEDQLRHAQKMEAVGQLAGGVAHDFNNLLVVIGGYTEMLLKRMPFEHPDRKKVEGIHYAAQRAVALTRQLLLFSRKQAPQISRFDLGRLVEESEDLLRRILGETIRVEIRRKDRDTTIQGDPNHFDQILVNFAANARDAMPQGGAFTLVVGRKTVVPGGKESPPCLPPGEYVELRVADTGCGMSAETQARLFEPFFTTKAPGKGTGLGLPIVYGIVRQAGGHLFVESQEGQGARFTILIPRAEAAATEASRARAEAAFGGGTETVLVVEDNAAVRDFLLDALRGAGYAPLGVASAEEALDRMAKEGARVQLVLSDVVMPGLGGIELARRLRAEKAHLPIVLVSGFSDDEAALRVARELGCVFLRKPFDVIELCRLMRRLLDDAAAQGSSL